MISIDDFRTEARNWISQNLEPLEHSNTKILRGVDNLSAEDLPPERELQRKIYQAGYAGISWPAEYGGQGLTKQHEVVFVEESANYRMPDFGVLTGTTFLVCGNTMLAHASPDFLSRHIPRILAGDELVVQFFSEPSAGSDLAGLTTRATRDGDDWILNGSKTWSSGAACADWGMCLARTNWDVPKHRGLTWFAVPCNAPGLRIDPIKEINGDEEFCQEFFDDVRISDAERIGPVDGGWNITHSMLVFERGAGRVVSETAPAGPGELAPDLVALAQRLGRTSAPNVRQLIASAHIDDYARQQLAYRIAGQIRKNGANTGMAAYGKLATGTYDPIRAQIALEIGGAAALTWEKGDRDGIEPSIDYLNSRVMSIAGGSNEVQRNGISERVLDLPREPAFDLDKPFREVERGGPGTEWSGKTSG
ncbi:acyl-CoA dehydrogenase family protein [Myxococcota bacterium]|nr:acyl-CoA dehydrogenase family protein [Myxococcota bacterium]